MSKIIVSLRKREKPSAPPKVDFPKMMVSESGTIVFFRVNGKGTKMNNSGNCSEVEMGQYFTDWYMDPFRDLADDEELVFSRGE